MKKKWLVLLLTAALTFGLLSGCGSPEASEGTGQQVQSGEESGGPAQGEGKDQAESEEAQNGENASSESGAAQEQGNDRAESGAAQDGEKDRAESGTAENSGNSDGSPAAEGSSAGGGSSTGTEIVNGYTVPELKLQAYDVPDTEAFAFVRSLKIGWNMGNTFDAYSDRTFANELDSETQWVGVATTQEMIDDLQEAGFNAIRIPVSWHGHVDGNYQISQVWLDRVQEVVDYAYQNGMYVILNIHHDNSEQFMYPSTQYLERSVRYVTTIWRQLAERFADYDEHMIFESMNEPRQVGTDWEWWINGSAECDDAIACINEINQAFVDTVRAAGGNNKTRYLMLPGYDASADGVLNDGYVLPADAEGVTDKLIVSVHAYTPYNFALQGPEESGSIADFQANALGSTKDITFFMERLYSKFIKNGIPVVIDEFGARDKGGNNQARVDYATFYVAAARARGMSCFWWDNNAFTGNGELFGLYDRKKGEFPYPEIIAGLMKYAD
ncbi:MAG: cellulase family glycosylhydrolase [Roseburia sp.]|nr:cellulase family glycosylhydrolase [Roseburia sp.]MCM1098920.1 cellulase family glycosylhydrolase [Ruminococcus flavefaciens]